MATITPDEAPRQLQWLSGQNEVGTAARQAELRAAAGDDGYIEDNLWTGIGRARSGCGAAIVGNPDQVLAKLRAYQALGIDAFILSGYPHMSECDMFARYVLPKLEHGKLSIG
jgi:alkanesulfonate monooxygenase